jgi:uncharacterized membrane protein
LFLSFVRLVRQYSRFLLVRVVLYALMALVAVASAILFGDYIPDSVTGFVGAEAMDAILTTLASSMLAVTTFSLSIMAAAMQGASGTLTPRSRLVLRQDGETQSVLSAFVGAFVFSLVTIILRATPLVGEKERFVLFCASVLVVCLVLVAIIRWIRRLETLGATDDTVLKLQARAEAAMKAYGAAPSLGAHVWTRAERDGMRGKSCIAAKRDGYVQQIMEELLQEVAKENDIFVYVAVSTGDYVVEGQPLVYADGSENLEITDQAKLREAVFLQQARGFDQDPQLGVTVLTEVASRALSPAVNDVQTAVDIVHRLSSVFLKAENGAHELRCSHVWIIPQALEEMFAASFDVIARDGADAGELMAAIVESLGRIEAMGQGELPKLARATAARLNLG